jgi:hypothetical protein
VVVAAAIFLPWVVMNAAPYNSLRLINLLCFSSPIKEESLGGAVLKQRLAEVKELQLMRSRCSKTTRAPVVVHSQNAVVADIAAGPAPAEMVPQYFKQQQQLVIGILVFRAASTIVTAFA